MFVLFALAATLVLGVRDVMSAAGTAALGEVWFALAPGSLNLAQAVTQRYIAPEVWDPGVIWLLELPAVAVSGLVAALLTGLALLRRRR